MTRDQKKSLVETLHAIWSDGDLDTIPNVYSPGFVAHMSKSWEVPEIHGHEGVRKAILDLRSAFPDWHESVVDMVIEGDRVVTRYISTGTHEGPFVGLAPTGIRIEIDEISIYRISESTVAEQWCLADDLTLSRQLGRR